MTPDAASDPLLGAVFAVLGATSWAIGAVLVRAGTQRLAVTTGTFVSAVSGFVVISALTVVLYRVEVLSVPWATIRWIGLLALMQFPVGRLLNYKAIRLAGVAPATSISGSSPLVAAVLATIFLHERITLPVVLGIVAVVVGLALVMGDSWATSGRSTTASPGKPTASSDPGLDSGSHHSPRSRAMTVMGLLCAVGGAFGYGASHTIARYVTASLPAPITATYALLFGAVVLLAMSLHRLPADFRIARPAVAKMAIAGVFSSFGLFFMYMALARAPVVLVSPLVALYPLVAMGLTHVFLQRLERITVRMALGGGLAALGIALVVIGRAR